MNSSKAKKISLYNLLTKLGYKPSEIKKSGREIWYLSPFRDEKTPSFKIRQDLNIWYDFGEGSGGNILDFVMRHKNCDFKSALFFLENTSLRETKNSFKSHSIDGGQHANLPENSREILKIESIQQFELREYLKERCIPLEIAQKYLKQITYKVNGKSYIALGFPNRSGGWEIRSSVFKGCLGKKDISIIESGSKKVNVFEGFMDYLSYLTLSRENKIDDDVIVMNSVTLRTNAIELIKTKEFSEVKTYFDNDKAGKDTLGIFKRKLQKISIISCNHLYKSCNDFNDLLKSFQREKINN